MTTSRERFLRTLEFQPVDVPWTRAYAFVWPETGATWRTQGYEGPELGWHGEGLPERFKLDQILRVDPWYGPVPEFEYQVIEEDERTKLYVNHEGILMREFKERSDTSMPQFVKFPVETGQDFEKLAAERLALHAEQRLNETWKKQVAAGKLHGVAGAANITAIGEDTTRESGVGSRESGVGTLARESGVEAAPLRQQGTTAHEHPRMCWADRWGGFFGSLRNMLGVQNLCMAFYDQPKLVERMMEERADRIIEITAEVMKYTSFEIFWYWEDMAYNHDSLVDPRMFRKFALKHYRRVNDWLRSRGVKHIGLDSDGNVTKLIPVWLESGINNLFPFEVQSGMDVLEVRKTYGRELTLVGGIDKRTLAKDTQAIHREIDRVMPLVEQGGYLPELDHSVPPDVSWPNFCGYVEYLNLRLGRG